MILSSLMSLALEEKQQLIASAARAPRDTGSPEVQITLLTGRIRSLTDHFKTHAKDHNSRRGLLKMVSRRRSLLDYLNSRNPERYRAILGSLGLRR